MWLRRSNVETTYVPLIVYQLVTDTCFPSPKCSVVDPELLPGSGIKVPDPAKSERAYTVQINKTVNSGVFVLLDSSIE